jgi:hypothetical protein
MTVGRRIFLAHAREDNAQVGKLCADLKDRGFDPWFDKVDLMPGQNWEIEIPKAIRQAGIFLACLSSRSVCPGGIVPAGPRRADHLAVEQRIEPLDVEAGALDVRPELQIDKGRF